MTTTVDIRLMDKDQVQMFLDNIGEAEFTVIFLKKDGTQRKLTGRLDPMATTRKENVPVMCSEEGAWKSFNINRVLYLGEV